VSAREIWELYSGGMGRGVGTNILPARSGMMYRGARARLAPLKGRTSETNKLRALLHEALSEHDAVGFYLASTDYLAMHTAEEWFDAAAGLRYGDLNLSEIYNVDVALTQLVLMRPDPPAMVMATPHAVGDYIRRGLGYQFNAKALRNRAERTAYRDIGTKRLLTGDAVCDYAEFCESLRIAVEIEAQEFCVAMFKRVQNVITGALGVSSQGHGSEWARVVKIMFSLCARQQPHNEITRTLREYLEVVAAP
jgi:hypothetical protein